MSGARRSVFRWALPAVLSSSLATLSACVTIDGTLKPDGSGTLEMAYQALPNSNEAIEKQRFTAPRVTIESLKVRDDGAAIVKLGFDDPTRLSALEMFRSVRIARRREGEEELLTITWTNPTPTELKEEGKPGPKISIAFPGKVLEASRNSTIAGNSVTWSFPRVAFMKEKSVELTARYLVSPSG